MAVAYLDFAPAFAEYYENMPPQKPKFTIEKGIVQDTRVMQALVPRLNHGPMGTVRAIVVHQTDSYTAKGTLAGYKALEAGNGAHFLIDKDGTIYQTIPADRKAQHVGPIKSKCMALHTCSVKGGRALADLKKQHLGGHAYAQAQAKIELAKPYPERFPFNGDSLGIEVVSKYLPEPNPDELFEVPTSQQQASLQWLVQNLMTALSLQATDIYRHAEIAAKKKGEARDATW